MATKNKMIPKTRKMTKTKTNAKLVHSKPGYFVLMSHPLKEYRKQEQIVLERSARLNMDPGSGDGVDG